MTADGESRLSLAIRRNRGRRESDAFLRAAAEALAIPREELRVVDLPETDAALAVLRERQRAIEAGAGWAKLEVHLRTGSREDVENGLRVLARSLDGLELLLHRGASEICGALRVPATCLIDRAFHLVGINQESLVAADREGNHGIVLDLTTEDAGSGPPSYRLVGWAGWAA